MRAYKILAVFNVLVVLAVAQLTRETNRELNINRIVDMQVMLSFEDGSTLRDINTGQNAANRAGQERDVANPNQHSRDVSTNLQIRVQLQDSFGTNVEEKSPNSEGKVTFQVRNGSSYRLRVTGAQIEESFVERVEPANGDRMLSVVLRRKSNGTSVQPSSTNTIPAVRLNVPPRALSELEKGTRALSDQSWKAARSSFEKAIEIYPSYDLAYNNLGVVLMELGETAKGRQAFEKAVELNGSFPRALINLAKIELAEKRFAQAYLLLQKAASTEPLNPQAWFLSTQAALYAEDPDAAIASAQRLHSLEHASYAVAHYLAGKAFEARDLKDQALQEYETFIKEAPQDPNVPLAQKQIQRLKSISGKN
ncbi:MAG TPA: tetratricopeptide repeat protein [Terriglobales bacterium]|nr:tetratricopeptide repeat protein [Terriglobales bacterium]